MWMWWRRRVRRGAEVGAGSGLGLPDDVALLVLFSNSLGAAES